METMPNGVRRRIMNRCATEDVIVVVSKGGKPSRVFGLPEYLKMKQHAAKVKPWRHRRKRSEGVDPLGAAEGKPLSALGRQEIYE